MSDVETVVETALYADDLDKAERFYTEVLGLHVAGREPGRHVFFAVGPTMLLLFNPRATITGEVLPAHGAQGPGHVALGIATSAWDEWIGRLAQHGVPIEREMTWPRGGRSIYFRDPAGNSIELLTRGVWGLTSGW